MVVLAEKIMKFCKLLMLVSVVSAPMALGDISKKINENTDKICLISSFFVGYFHRKYIVHRSAMLEETWPSETWFYSKQAENALKARIMRNIFAVSSAGLILHAHHRSMHADTRQLKSVWKS